MNAGEARARIEDETQWQAAPALSAGEIDRLLARSQVADAEGREPGSAGYVATHSLSSVRASIAAGWRMKAGKAAGLFDAKAGDVEAKRSQVQASCMAMARRYGGSGLGLGDGPGGMGTVTVGTALSEAGS